MVAGILLSGTPLGGALGTEEPASLRIAFSRSMFTDVNENDARASVKAWAEIVAGERGVEIEPVPEILGGEDEIRAALLSRAVDAVGMTTPEYLALSPEIPWGTLFLARVGGSIVETYVLLARRDRGIRRVEDLGGRSLLLHHNPRSSLAGPWLDACFRAHGLASRPRSEARIEERDKLAQVVLPVYFGTMDACLVSRRGFEMMAELNPQVGRDLVVLAESPEVVPAVFVFSAFYDSPVRQEVLDGIRELHLSAAGRQVLTLFQSEAMEEHPHAILEVSADIQPAHREPGPGGEAPAGGLPSTGRAPGRSGP